MTWQFTPYALAMIVTAGISVGVAIAAWQRRTMPGGLPVALLMLAVVELTLTTALELAAVGVPAKIFWSKLEYLGNVYAPILFLLFALEYTRQDKWRARRNIVLFCIVPTIILLLVATNEWHSLIWISFTPSPAGDNLLVYGHGAGFWAAVVCFYCVLLVGTLILIRAIVRFPERYRRQAGTVLLASVVPLVGSVIYVSNLNPVPGFDWTPISLAISGTLLALSMFQFRLFDLVPVARDAMIENMSDGVLVLDEQNRIVDINPAAQRMLRITAKSAIGQYAGIALAAFPDLVERLPHLTEAQMEISLDSDPPRYLDLRITPWHVRSRHLPGWLIVLRDVTERKQAEEQLQQANQLMQVQLTEIKALQAELREQAIRDPLTGLFNRRYLEETLERELARAAREKYPVSLAMLDIDHFKTLNDTFGHQAGDYMLQALAELLRTQSRRGDLACRLGGEEFVMILPGATLEIARKRAEGWRISFDALLVLHDDKELASTVSVGIATFPDHATTTDELLAAADKALYAAKAAGRNCVVVWHGDSQ